MGDSSDSANIFNLVGSIFSISAASSAVSAVSTVSYSDTRQQNAQLCHNAFVDVDQLIAQIGDLIEFERALYYHWGIYMVYGVVIHFVNIGDGIGKVIQQSLPEAADGGKCRVNNLDAAANGYGLQRKAGKDTVAMAVSFVDETRAYHAVNQNCEHFVTQCAYDKAFSLQQNNVMGKPFVHLAAVIGSRNSTKSRSKFD